MSKIVEITFIIPDEMAACQIADILTQTIEKTNWSLPSGLVLDTVEPVKREGCSDFYILKGSNDNKK